LLFALACPAATIAPSFDNPMQNYRYSADDSLPPMIAPILKKSFVHEKHGKHERKQPVILIKVTTFRVIFSSIYPIGFFRAFRDFRGLNAVFGFKYTSHAGLRNTPRIRLHPPSYATARHG
jgi:hypothetical protein